MKRKIVLFTLVAAGLMCTLLGCNRSDYSVSQSEVQDIISQTSGVVESEMGKLSRDVREFTPVTYDNVVIPIPTEYVNLLVIKGPLVNEEETDDEFEVDKTFEVYKKHSKVLASVYEKKSVIQGEKQHPGEDWGDGWLFTLVELDKIGFEYWLCTEPNDSEIIGRNTKLGTYYLMEKPTDVRMVRSDLDMQKLAKLSEFEDVDKAIADGYITQKEVDAIRDVIHDWSMLVDWTNKVLPCDMVYMNADMEAYSDSSFRNSNAYTYESQHKRVVYYADKEHDDIVYIVLSQPKVQGKGGIWCVDRIINIYAGYPDYRLYFPVASGIEQTAEEYYDIAQKSCDKGESIYKWMLSPLDVAYKLTQGPAWYYGEVSLKELGIVED